MVERIPMTRQGHEKLRLELNHLQREERPVVIKAIEVAREHGDLKENAEYHAAKERQSHIEGRIMELKDKLSRAEVIEVGELTCEWVVFGVVVKLVDLDSDEEVSYQLLGPEEARVETGSISVLSPLGRAMIGKSEGDEIVVKTPGGVRQFEILEISLPPAE